MGRLLQHVPHFPFSLFILLYIIFLKNKTVTPIREDLPLRVISDRRRANLRGGSFHTILECCCPPLPS